MMALSRDGLLKGGRGRRAGRDKQASVTGWGGTFVLQAC